MAADAAHAPDRQSKAKIFISYSRKDMTFADQLEAALKARGFEVLIDRQEIYAFEDWWKRIEALIGGADTVVFVLSPDAVRSDVALKEVTRAASLNKRFAPIIYRRVEDGAVPEGLRRLNFIFFDDPDGFDASADQLAEALQTDIGWIRKHTEYGERAREWTENARAAGLLLRPPLLDQAETWLSLRPSGAPAPTADTAQYLAESRRANTEAQIAEAKTNRRWRFAQAAIFVLMIGIILGLVGWIEQAFIKKHWLWWTSQRPFVSANIWPHVLKPEAERALKPGNAFRECTPRQQNADYCPDMVVLPSGTFDMGSLLAEKNGYPNELPQHSVTIAASFAVSKFELTFAEWDACVAGGGCDGYTPSDLGWGRGQQPVINVSWDDAQQYVAWLSQMTGKRYRLLTEAEYEYAARAETTTEYPWGDEAGKNNASCNGCGSRWDNTRAAPVGSFAPNRFGLYDMVGNVWEWIEDCYHPGYEIETPQGKLSAPSDGSAWTSHDCPNSVVRGGSWNSLPSGLRSAYRVRTAPGARLDNRGFRVGRTLLAH